VDAVLAVVIIVGLYLHSRRDAVTAANAMSDVAESGHAVDLPDEVPPTPRQERASRARAEAKKRARASAPEDVATDIKEPGQ